MRLHKPHLVLDRVGAAHRDAAGLPLDGERRADEGGVEGLAVQVRNLEHLPRRGALAEDVMTRPLHPGEGVEPAGIVRRQEELRLAVVVRGAEPAVHRGADVPALLFLHASLEVPVGHDQPLAMPALRAAALLRLPEPAPELVGEPGVLGPWASRFSVTCPMRLSPAPGAGQARSGLDRAMAPWCDASGCAETTGDPPLAGRATPMTTERELRTVTYFRAPGDGRIVAIYIRSDFDGFAKFPPFMESEEELRHVREAYRLSDPASERHTKAHITDTRGPCRSSCSSATRGHDHAPLPRPHRGSAAPADPPPDPPLPARPGAARHFHQGGTSPGRRVPGRQRPRAYAGGPRGTS